MTSVNWSKGTPADRTAQGRDRTAASRLQPSGEPGYSSFEQVDVEVVEEAGRLDNRIFAGLTAKLYPAARR